MDPIEHLKMMLGLKAAMDELDDLCNKLGEEATAPALKLLNDIDHPKFEALVINTLKEEVGEETFKTLAAAPSFKDVLDNFRQKMVKQQVGKIFDSLNEAAKAKGIEHKLTPEIFFAAIASMAQLRKNGAIPS